MVRNVMVLLAFSYAFSWISAFVGLSDPIWPGPHRGRWL